MRQLLNKNTLSVERGVALKLQKHLNRMQEHSRSLGRSYFLGLQTCYLASGFLHFVALAYAVSSSTF